MQELRSYRVECQQFGKQIKIGAARSFEQAARIFIRCWRPSPQYVVKIWDNQGNGPITFYARGRTWSR